METRTLFSDRFRRRLLDKMCLTPTRHELMACVILYNLKTPAPCLDSETPHDLSSLLKCTGIYDGLIDTLTQNLCPSELQDEPFIEKTIETIIVTITTTIYSVLDDLKTDACDVCSK